MCFSVLLEVASSHGCGLGAEISLALDSDMVCSGTLLEHVGRMLMLCLRPRAQTEDFTHH